MGSPFLRRAAAAGACAAGAAVAVAVAGCGSGAATTTSRPTASATPSTSASTSTSTVTTTATVATTALATTAAAGPSGCTAGQIEVVVGPSQAGLGHVGFVLLFHNSGAAACTLTGYPGVALAGAGHGEVQVPRSPNGYMGGLASRDRVDPVVSIAPGRAASALLEGEGFDNATQKPCPRYTTLLVTPPNQTVTRRLADKLSLCRPTIHPVVRGTSGREG